MTPDTFQKVQPLWGRFVRFFHWALVSCVSFNYFVMDDGKTWHQWVGYFAVSLVGCRIGRGFVVSPHARFSSFFPTPRRVVLHWREMKAGQHPPAEGHNPLDAFWGESWLQDLHEVIGNTPIGLATLHAIAALVMGRLERARLVKAMVTGVKERW